MSRAEVAEAVGRLPKAGTPSSERGGISGEAVSDSANAPEYGDDGYLVAVRGHITSLVSLDDRLGGSELFRVAVRLFRSMRARLDSGRYDRRIERDLHAAAGELAEVAGWLAFDAERHDLVRRLNQESLYFTRLAGDRSIELLTVQNASMHAGRLGRPNEALRLARSVLEADYRLSSRLRTLFLTRQARALAQLGDESALRLFQRIRALYLDGVADSDPAWAWWVDERELAWHEAMAQRDLGMTGPSMSEFYRSVEMIPEGETRRQYVHRAYLLRAQIDTGSWSDVETTIRSLVPLVDQVASNRTVAILGDAVGRISDRPSVPGRIMEQVSLLSSALDAAL